MGLHYWVIAAIALVIVVCVVVAWLGGGRHLAKAFTGTVKLIEKFGKHVLWPVLAITLTLIPAAAWGDRRGAVAENEPGVVVASQWASAIAYVTFLPAVLWIVATTFHPQTLWLLLPWLVASTFWFSRRFSAHQAVEFGIRDFMSGFHALFSPEDEETVFDAEGVAKKQLKFAPWRALTGVALIVAALSIPLALSPAWVGILPDGGEFMLAAAPWYPLVALAGYWIWLTMFARIGVLHGRENGYSARDDHLTSLYALVLGITQAQFEQNSGAWTLSKSMDTVTISPVPAPARAKLNDGKLDWRCEQILGDWGVQSSSADEVVLTLISNLPEVQASRLARDESGGLLSGYRNAPDTELRPRQVVWTIAPDSRARPEQIDAAGQAQRLRLVELDESGQDRLAYMARLSPEVQQVRARLAQLLGKHEHDIELQITMAGARIDQVEIVRFPNLGLDGDKRVETWKKLVAAIPDGSNGWTINDDPVTGNVTLTYGDPRVLPSIIDGKILLPRAIDTDNWSEFTIGVNDKGEDVCLSLSAGPHSLVVGGTGSGKSVSLRAIMLNALAKGFDVLIIDPLKLAAGLKEFGPWTRGIFTRDVPQAAAALTAIYAEVRSRVNLIDEVNGENWRDLPAGTVKPLLVVIDEYASLTTPDDKPIGVPATDPEMVEWAEMASAKARIKSIVGKLAREARSAGVHLVISLQRPDAAAVGGDVRDNLGSIVQLVVPSRPPSPEALRMVFPVDYVPLAMTEIGELNDGRSRGFALSYIEGGGVQGFRVGLLEQADIAEYCERLGIPFGEPLDIGEAAATGPFRRPGAPETPVITTVGEFEFTLDDLEDEPQAPAELPVEFDFELELADSSPAPAQRPTEYDFAPDLAVSEAPATDLLPAPAWPMPAAAPQPLEVDDFEFTLQ